MERAKPELLRLTDGAKKREALDLAARCLAEMPLHIVFLNMKRADKSTKRTSHPRSQNIVSHGTSDILYPKKYNTVGGAHGRIQRVGFILKAKAIF